MYRFGQNAVPCTLNQNKPEFKREFCNVLPMNEERMAMFMNRFTNPCSFAFCHKFTSFTSDMRQM